MPETTPVLEAARLQDDLKRAGIAPWGWIVNASLAGAETRDPLLVRRAEDEVGQIERVRTGLARRLAIVPMLAEAPVGAERLRALARTAAPDELAPDARWASSQSASVPEITVS